MATVDILSTQSLPKQPECRDLPQTQPLITESWQDLLVIQIRPSKQALQRHAAALPEDFSYTSDVQLFIGTLVGSTMHRDGQDHIWLSNPYLNQPVMWLQAQLQTQSRAWFTNVAGWVGPQALAGLLPGSVRIADRPAQISLGHNPRPGSSLIHGLIQAANSESLAYQIDTRKLALADKKCCPLWLDSAHVSGSFSTAAAGRVRIAAQARLTANRPDSLLVHADPGSLLADLVNLNHVQQITYMPGSAVITRHLPQCLSGEACQTRWTLIEPSAKLTAKA